jgi:hypothetical protein
VASASSNVADAASPGNSRLRPPPATTGLLFGHCSTVSSVVEATYFWVPLIQLANGSSVEVGQYPAHSVEVLGEAEPVGHEEHRDARVQQGADDLAADLGSLALVGPGEGLVEQHEAVRADPVGDDAHPPQGRTGPS